MHWLPIDFEMRAMHLKMKANERALAGKGFKRNK